MFFYRNLDKGNCSICRYVQVEGFVIRKLEQYFLLY